MDRMIEQLQIDEENPDVQEIMLQIRRVIAQQKLGLESVREESQRPGRLSQPVYDHLFQALGAYDQTRVEAYLSPSTVPLIGPLWQRLRRLAHNLVLFYLDRLSDRQIHFNEQLIRALEGLVHDLETEPSPAALQEQITVLREQLAELQTRMAQRSGEGE